MDYLNYFDKNKAVNYVVEEAKRQRMPITKLCDGIMDSSNFMKIVKGVGNREMKIENLLKMAEKLKISEAAFIKASLPDEVALYNHILEIKRFNDRRDYKSLEKNLRTFEKVYGDNTNPGVQQLIYWLQGVCLAMNHQRYDEALLLFNKAMKLTYPSFIYPLPKCFLDEHEIDVYNSFLFVLGYFLHDRNVLDEYTRLLGTLEGRYFEPDIYIRLYYSYAFILAYNKLFKDSLKTLKTGYDLAIASNCMSMAPFYMSLYSKVQFALGAKEEAEDASKKAEILMEVFQVPDDMVSLNEDMFSKIDFGFWEI